MAPFVSAIAAFITATGALSLPVSTENTAVESVEPITLPLHPRATLFSSQSASNIPLRDHALDRSFGFLIDMSVGGTTYKLMLDSGSPDSFLYATDMSKTAYSFRPPEGEGLFDFKHDSYKTKNKKGTITFVDSTGVKGIWAKDDFEIPNTGWAAPGMSFIHAQSGSLKAKAPMVGLLGFGWPEKKDPSRAPFWSQALKSGHRTFGVYLADTEGQLTLGGYNSACIKGGDTKNIPYVPLVKRRTLNSLIIPTQAWWDVELQGMKVGDSTMTLKGRATIDTAAVGIHGPPKAVAKLYKQFFPTATLIGDGRYEMDCNQVPAEPVEWTFGNGTWFGMNRYAFWGERYGDRCLGALSPGVVDTNDLMTSVKVKLYDLAFDGSDDWLFGDSFMRNVYTIHEADAFRIGFAPLATDNTCK